MGLGFFLVLAFLIFLVVYTIVQFLKFLDSLVKGTGDTIMPVKRGSVLMPLVFALVILSSMPFLLHAQVYEKEKGQQSEPPKLLTPVEPPGKAELEALLIEAAKIRAAEEIAPKLNTYKIYLSPEKTLTICAKSVRPAGPIVKLGTEQRTVVQFLNGEGKVFAEFYTVRILGWQECKPGCEE